MTTTGTVIGFDDDRGWGTVRAEDGAEHFFHCVAVADGSRTIAVGAAVRFVVRPGLLGCWEADGLEPV